MTSIRVLLSRITTKKVPALTLVVVGLVGMVAGVLAATITVTTTPFTGEAGHVHTNSGAFTITDGGLSVIATTGGGNSTSMVIPSSSSNNVAYVTATVAGDWAYAITLSTSLTDGTSHTVTATFRSGTTLGTSLQTFTGSIAAPSGPTSSKTATIYIDLGTADITSAVITVYVNIN